MCWTIMPLKEHFDNNRTLENIKHSEDVVANYKNQLVWLLNNNERKDRVVNMFNCSINKEKYHNQTRLMKLFCERYPNVMWEFYRKYYTENAPYDINIVEFEDIKDEFISELRSNVNITTEYQPVLNKKNQKVFEEALLRVDAQNSISNISHIDYIFIHRVLDKWLETLDDITTILFQDIHRWKTWPISINIEIDDLMNDGFLDVLKRNADIYGLRYDQLHSENMHIIIELKYNSKNYINITEELQSKIISLKMMWFDICIDNINLCTDSIKHTENLIKVLGDVNIDSIKVNWECIQYLYKQYAEDTNGFFKWLMERAEVIDFIRCEGIEIIAEWVEDRKIYEFVRWILWIDNVQWFYTDDLIKNN